MSTWCQREPEPACWKTTELAIILLRQKKTAIILLRQKKTEPISKRTILTMEKGSKEAPAPGLKPPPGQNQEKETATQTTTAAVEKEKGQEPGQKKKAPAEEKKTAAEEEVSDEGLDGKPPALAKAGDEDEEDEEEEEDEDDGRRTPTGGSSEDSAPPSQAAKLRSQQKNKLKEVVVPAPKNPRAKSASSKKPFERSVTGRKAPVGGLRRPKVGTGRARVAKGKASKARDADTEEYDPSDHHDTDEDTPVRKRKASPKAAADSAKKSAKKLKAPPTGGSSNSSVESSEQSGKVSKYQARPVVCGPEESDGKLVTKTPMKGYAVVWKIQYHRPNRGYDLHYFLGPMRWSRRIEAETFARLFVEQVAKKVSLSKVIEAWVDFARLRMSSETDKARAGGDLFAEEELEGADQVTARLAARSDLGLASTVALPQCAWIVTVQLANKIVVASRLSVWSVSFTNPKEGKSIMDAWDLYHPKATFESLDTLMGQIRVPHRLPAMSVDQVKTLAGSIDVEPIGMETSPAEAM